MKKPQEPRPITTPITTPITMGKSDARDGGPISEKYWMNAPGHMARTLGRIERGVQNISLGNIGKIARAEGQARGYLPGCALKT